MVIDMFKGIIANYRYNQGYTYVKRIKASASGGKRIVSDGLEYDKMPIAFIPENMKPKWTPEGYKHLGFAAAVVPSRFFTNNTFTPNMDDVIKTPDGKRYRITAISDYSDQPFMGVYHLMLKREEYDGTERVS
jgi:hypothetical protein